jgi:hypothetical protein
MPPAARGAPLAALFLLLIAAGSQGADPEYLIGVGKSANRVWNAASAVEIVSC